MARRVRIVKAFDQATAIEDAGYRQRVVRVSRARQAATNNPRRAGSPFIELGQTGINRVGGQITEEFLPQLAGRRAVRVYREMSDNDPVVGAVLFTIDMLLRSVKWVVEPVSEKEDDKDAADFVRECMEDMSHSWESLVSEIMSMLIFGWSFHEVIYKRRLGGQDSRFDDGRVGWAHIPIRAQESLYTWSYDESTGQALALKQQPAPNFEIITIPFAKGLLFRTQSRKNNPEGRSIFRNAYRPWYFKKRFEEIEGIGVERDLAGLPVAGVPAEILSAEPGTDEYSMKTAMEDLVANIRRDEQEGVLFPLEYDEHGNKVFDLSLLSTGGTR